MSKKGRVQMIQGGAKTSGNSSEAITPPCPRHRPHRRSPHRPRRRSALLVGRPPNRRPRRNHPRRHRPVRPRRLRPLHRLWIRRLRHELPARSD